MIFFRARLTLYCITVLYAAPAYAYLDPGTGSLLIQGIIASIAAAGAIVRLYWHRIISVFRSQKPEDEKPEASKADDSTN